MRSIDLNRFSGFARRMIPIAFFISLSWAISGVVVAGERKEILIGVCNSVSGKVAPAGNESRWAYELAVADINQAGGIYVREFDRKLPVRLIIADNESDAAVAARVTERLIVADKVDMILGTQFSDLVIASCKIAEKYQVYYHSTTTFIPMFLEMRFKWATNIFFDMDQATEAPFKIWEAISPEERPRRHALLTEGTPRGVFFRSHFNKSAKKLGFHFLVDELLPETRDYLTLVLELKRENIDSVLIFGDPADCIAFVRQVKKAGLNLKYLHTWKGAWTVEFWKALGMDAQYVVSDGVWSEAFPYPGAKRLGDLFFRQFGKQSLSVGILYGACQILFKAIEVAGTLDSAKIREAVLTTQFQGTVLGDIRYTPDGVAIIPCTANQWWNGEPKWFYPFGERSWQLKLMLPWDQR